MTYDCQLIAVVHPAAFPGAQVLNGGANALRSVKRINSVAIDPTSGAASEIAQQRFSKLTSKSRLYLFAHGGEGSIGGVSGKKLANFLKKKCGLKGAAKIVLISCGGPTSLAAVQEFHHALKVPNDISTDVFAYTSPIKVIDARDMELVEQLPETDVIRQTLKLGQRVLDTGSGLADFKRPRDVEVSKYMFGWVAHVQCFDTVY